MLLEQSSRKAVFERILYLENSNIVGAGAYGLVINPKSKREVFKLFYDLSSAKKMAMEAEIQQKAYFLFKKYLPEVGIPKVTYFKQAAIKFNTTNYLCGIGMKYLVPPKGYDAAVHVILGYEDDDIDTYWVPSQSLHRIPPVVILPAKPPLKIFGQIHNQI